MSVLQPLTQTQIVIWHYLRVKVFFVCGFVLCLYVCSVSLCVCVRVSKIYTDNEHLQGAVRLTLSMAGKNYQGVETGWGAAYTYTLQ